MTASNLMGAIILADNQVNLKELTLRRQLAAVPFGARYRLIDFPLSNLVNAGVRNVGVFVQEKHRSLMDHIGIGKEWDLNSGNENWEYNAKDACRTYEIALAQIPIIESAKLQKQFAFQMKLQKHT
ncbi:MAG TPA: sugar phosphate nucleotidyltransferase, partial [Bacillota bacterium]|nr:sugar phosphate nucleotidyltransferase [Bacillota bacterium]